jgi:hypothetical protein
MKKVVRMLGLCALVALAFTACKKNDTQKVTFTASITQPASATRTHAVGFGHHLVWDGGDQIKVFNNAGNDMDFALPTDITSAQQATFNVVESDKVDFISNLFTEPYYAFYPNAVVEGEQVKMVIPAVQTYVPQRNFANELYPMVGFNFNDVDGYSDNFQFISNAGFLNVSFTCPENQSGQIAITQVVLRSMDPVDDLLNGVVYYDKDGSNYSFVGETNEIVMALETPAVLDWQMARDFTFVLPEGALWSGFEIDVTLDNGVVKTYEAPAQVNVIEAMTYTAMIPMTVGDQNNHHIVILP